MILVISFWMFLVHLIVDNSYHQFIYINKLIQKWMVLVISLQMSLVRVKYPVLDTS